MPPRDLTPGLRHSSKRSSLTHSEIEQDERSVTHSQEAAIGLTQAQDLYLRGIDFLLGLNKSFTPNPQTPRWLLVLSEESSTFLLIHLHFTFHCASLVWLSFLNVASERQYWVSKEVLTAGPCSPKMENFPRQMGKTFPDNQGSTLSAIYQSSYNSSQNSLAKDVGLG